MASDGFGAVRSCGRCGQVYGAGSTHVCTSAFVRAGNTPADPRDAEIARLRSEVERLMRERDEAREALLACHVCGATVGTCHAPFCSCCPSAEAEETVAQAKARRDGLLETARINFAKADALAARLREAEGLLRGVEWGAEVCTCCPDADNHDGCPVCGAWRVSSAGTEKHADDCALAAFLAASGAQEGEGGT